MVDGADSNHRHPTERAGVHMTDGPIGVMRHRIHTFNRHHRAFKRGHAVERQ